jgi:hypothetical protein
VRTEQAGGLVGKTSGGKLAGVARQQADTPGRAGVDMPARAVGARTFFLVAGYWIDAEVAEHPQAELVEITSRGTEGNEIRKALPEVEGLAREAAGGQAGTPIVHWQGRNCVVR